MLDISKQEIKLFYCYAREDKTLRDELEKHLRSLKRLYPLREWHDREILPGEEWEHAIDTHLNTSHLILLLVSPDFMNSDYCYGKEMRRALERHDEGTCRVIPILLRPSFIEAAPFGKLQMLPTDARPITRWPDRDEAFQDVVREISFVLKDLLITLKTKKDWLDEGISFRNLKRYNEALEAFEQAISLDPNYLEAYQEKGAALHDLKRYDEALEAYERALHLNPNLVALYVAKGQTLDSLKNYNEALTIFEQAIRLDSSFTSAYIGKDKALQHLGISKEAQEQLKSQLAKANTQLSSEQKRTELLESQLAKANNQLASKQKRVEELESQLAGTNTQLTSEQKRTELLESQLAKANNQFASKQKRVEELESQLVKANNQFASEQKRLEQPYELQRISTIRDTARICPNCQNQVADGVRFCATCGHPMPKESNSIFSSISSREESLNSQRRVSSFCPRCASQVANGVKFCGNCGTLMPTT